MKQGDIVQTNSSGKARILELKSGNPKCKILFLNTNHIKEVYRCHLLKGKVSDTLMSDSEILSKFYYNKENQKYKIIEIIKTKNTYKRFKVQFIKSKNIYIVPWESIRNKTTEDLIFKEKLFKEKIWFQKCCNDSLKILEKLNDGSRRYKCIFIKTPCEVIAYKNHIIDGQVFNPKCKGNYIPESKIFDKELYKYITNCYNHLKQRICDKKCKNFDSYGNKGIFIDEDWINNFENFYDWYLNNLKIYKNSIYNYKNLELDKDIIYNIKNLKVKKYSKDTCLLIPKRINTFLGGDSITSGITKNKDNIYRYDLTLNYKIYRAFGFKSFKEAKLEYSKLKYDYWIKLLNELKLPSEIEGLLKKYDFSWGINN